MADTKETYEAADTTKAASPAYAEDVPVDNDGLGALPADRPDGWMYLERKIGHMVIPWYASPMFQLIMVSIVCFTCPGMFNALTGLGGGGREDNVLASNMVIPHFSTLLNRVAGEVVRDVTGARGARVGGEMRQRWGDFQK